LILGPLEDSLEDISDPLNRKQRERQLIIHRNSLRLLRLVNSILDFSRIEEGRYSSSFEAVNLSDYLLELCGVFRSMIEKAGLEFQVEIGKISEKIYLDRHMWEKIVFNLLSNAFKFTLFGSIKVTLEQLDRRVAIRIADTGGEISGKFR
jgi:signal transduction histidine kinase